MKHWICAILIGVLLLPQASLAADVGTDAPAAKRCGVSFRGVAIGTLKATPHVALGALKVTAHVLVSVPKALAFPLWFPLHATWMAGRAYIKGAGRDALWKIPLRLILKDGLAGLAWGAMYASARGTIMTTWEMDRYSMAGDKDEPEDLIVYVNAFNDDDDPVFHEATERYYEHKYGGRARRVKINPENMEDLRDQLRALVAKEGRKIKRLEFYGHGIKGGIMIKDEALGAYELNRRAADLKMTDVFDKKAKTVFYTCWTGDGREGKEFMDSWGRLAFDRGGSVYGSKITLGGSPYLFTDLLATPYLAFIGRGDALDQVKMGNPYYRWDKFTKMDIPERARVLAPGE